MLGPHQEPRQVREVTQERIHGLEAEFRRELQPERRDLMPQRHDRAPYHLGRESMAFFDGQRRYAHGCFDDGGEIADLQTAGEVEGADTVRPAGYAAAAGGFVFRAGLAGRGTAGKAEGGEVGEGAKGAEEVEHLKGFTDQREVEVFELCAFRERGKAVDPEKEVLAHVRRISGEMAYPNELWGATNCSRFSFTRPRSRPVKLLEPSCTRPLISSRRTKPANGLLRTWALMDGHSERTSN